MYDQYNRKIDYLRISLTDRCNLHCRYCQPEVSEHVPHNEILRYEELLRICRAALQLGIRKFKLPAASLCYASAAAILSPA